LHDRIIFKQGTTFGTTFAGSSTNATRVWMQCRSSQHEIGAKATEFGAVHQCADVFYLGVRASTVQTVLNGLYANVMTVGAVVNAVMHRLVDVGVNRVRLVVGHVCRLSNHEEIARPEG
jgi:hypothetical protein